MKVAICLIRRIYSGSFQNLSLPDTSGLRGSEMAGHEQQILHFITPRSASTVSQENSWRHLVWNTLLCLLESYSLSSNFVFHFAFFSAPVLSLTGFGDFVTKAMFTRDRFQMVPIQKSCWIGLLFTRDLLTVPSIRSRSGPKTGPPKKQVQFLEPFRSQTDPSPCKHLDRFLLADPSLCKHLDRSLLLLRRHFERNSCFSYFDSVPNNNRPVQCGQTLISGTVPCELKWSVPG